MFTIIISYEIIAVSFSGDFPSSFEMFCRLNIRNITEKSSTFCHFHNDYGNDLHCSFRFYRMYITISYNFHFYIKKRVKICKFDFFIIALSSDFMYWKNVQFLFCIFYNDHLLNNVKKKNSDKFTTTCRWSSVEYSLEKKGISLVFFYKTNWIPLKKM